MAFWGVEVKPGQSLKVDADEVIHISQASLGEVKDDNGAKNVLLRMKVGKENFVIGTLSAGERPQIMCDLYLNKEFELSHDLKSGSVYFLGYSEPEFGEEESDSDDTSESEEDLPINALENAKTANGLKQEEKKKAATQVPSKKPALKPSKPAVEDHDPDEDDDSFDDDDFGSEDSDESMEDGDSSDEAESDEDDSDEETPVPMEQPKKRQAESGAATKAPQKKAKQTPPQKTVTKKVPSPAKQPKTTPHSMNSSNKSKKKNFPRKL
ncbi:unnamed protein product [Cuscuta epithymum]|uniref:Nucleoplasmin-like domain-containing protein n=1 Tax=Cuscuta epithymum TaxID=186058 RepID=A0AAV0D773_9ASTE|nr:unnamed protein product [Cuscuta epithymum]CAH9148430.1 unnamed protein product [Cuscuta epithymum]